MGKSGQREQLNISLSRGAVLPTSVLTTHTLPEILDRAAQLETGITICGPNQQTDFQSYSDLSQEAASILGMLRQHGLKPQYKVILQLNNTRHFFAGLWACFLGGFVPVPLGVELGLNRNHSKLLQAWQLCDAPVILTEENLKQEIIKLDVNLSLLVVEELLDNPPDRNWHNAKLDDLALLLFTSGSTGKPKGVMLSARNLLASSYGMAKVNQLSRQDITLNWMKLEHVASLVMFHLTEVYLGCQQIQVDSELILQNPLQWLDLIDKYRVTASWSPNFAYNLVNEQLINTAQQNWDLSCLRWLGNGAEAVVGQTTQRFLELLAPYGLAPNAVSPGYGMSETCSGIAHSHNFNLHQDAEFVEVGAPIPGVALRIVDEAHQILPEGQIGLLQVKGETVTAGYYQQPELNQEIFTADGWFNTGDLGFLKQGKLTITGRQKDVIIVNGVNYYNHEIEAVVEAIAEISISYTAACGVIDSHQQEQIAIFFHSKVTKQDQLRNLIKTIRKNVFEQIGVAPNYIIPVEQTEIPKTAIGKIQRPQLKKRFAAGKFDSVIESIAELLNNRNLSQQELPHNAIEQRLVAVWQEVLKLETVGVNDNFFELGGNSLLLMQVLSKLTKAGDRLSAVNLFQYPTIGALANYLNSDRKSEAVQQGKLRGELRRKKTGNQDIAIIGMSCRFPGANNIEEFWDNLCNGVESISFFSDREVLESGVDNDLLNNTHYVKASPILDNIEDFDADFWGYNPKEAQLLDPQQRLFLECAWESLEDAGYDPLSYPGEIGLYGGAATNTYLLNHIYPNRHKIDERDRLRIMNLSSMGGFQVTVANDKDYLATRTSYKLNLTGPSVNIQTACSTSLVTVHLACQSLINAECEIALAGGVSVHTPQKMGYLYQEGMILSPDGHCRAFDADAAGTIFGSGAGMVVLKVLDKAIADGDRIYGVIKGSAVNNDGGNKVGYLAPNVDGQTRAIAETLAVADIAPETISYIEAHGTGTKLGDPIEIAALTQAFCRGEGPFAARQSHCAVGSVKTNVGHLQMASGIVGLIKTTLCLYHQKIPASLHFSKPNPQIDFDNSPFYINNQLQDWQAANYPRRAGVNSLGIGGTNAHLIIEEFITKKAKNNQPLPAYLLTLSAKNKTALAESNKSYQEYLIKHPDSNMADICLTSNLGRHHFEYRQAIVARSKEELANKLQEISTASIIQQNNKIAWLFTGQGSQYIGMAQELYSTQPLFRDNINQCAEILKNYLDKPLQDIIFDNGISHRKNAARRDVACYVSTGTGTGTEIDHQQLKINQTQYTQPLLFAIAYSLSQLWLSWGIKPDVVMGHSLGEYVAACIAGVLSLEDGLKLVATRGKLMQSLPNNGAMLAVFSDINRVNNLLNQDVTIAANNGSHLVLSGLKNAVTNIVQKLDLLAIKYRYLKVSHAFHSPLMKPIAEEFKAVAQTIDYATPEIPIVSNLTGELATDAIATSDYWVNHILQPVKFDQSIKFLDEQKINIFLEIGAKPTLIGMAKNILNNKIYLPSLNPQLNDWQQLLESLKQLYLQGVTINWSEVTRNYNGTKVSLPTYPFQRKRYWFDLPPEIPQPQIRKKHDRLTITSRTPLTIDSNQINGDIDKNKLLNSFHPLLGKPLTSPLKQIIFQSHLQPETINWLQEHCLENKPVLPGTAYLEIAIAAGRYHLKTNKLTIENVAITSPLLIGEGLGERSENIPEIQTILTPAKELATWEIYSSNNNDQWQLHSSGRVVPLVSKAEDIDLESLQNKFIGAELDIKQYYQQCQKRGLNYGQSFRAIKKLWATDNQALGLIELPNNLTKNSNNYYLHPALLDACLQILFATLPAELQKITFVPIGLDKLHLHELSGNRVWSYLKLNNNRNHKILTADVWLYSDRGELIAKLEGLKSQAIKSQATWHNWLYQQQWQAQKLQTAYSLHNKPGTWLIFADNTGIGKQLVTLLESQNQQCYVVIDQDNHSLNSNALESWQFLIEQYSDIRGVIYLWSLDSREDWQECKNYLYLIQALAKQNLPQNPRLWFVTRNAQAVNSYQLTSGIRQSCLWGMQKAIALEYPELSPCGIDLDCHYSEHDIENIFREIAAAENEQVAYRNNQRYISRLVKSNLNFQSANSQLQITNTGNLDSLQWQSISREQPKDHEIEIQVQTTGLNFRDVMVALDLYPDEAKFLGLECTGIVTQIGNKVSNFKIGDEVIALTANSFGEYLTVNSLLAIPKPKCLSFEEATTIPVTFLTAYYTLSHLAQLQPGEKILIHAAAGGVGLAAIQIAQQLGAEIFATASPGKWELLKSMGITNIMNSRNLDFADEIMSATNGQGVDVILNSLSGKFIPQSLSVLNNRGRFIEIGKQDIWPKNDIAHIKPSISYFIVDLWQITQNKPELIQQMLSELLPQFTTGQLKPLPQTIFTSDRITEAFRYMQQGKHQGKIVITQNPQLPKSSPILPVSQPQIFFRGTYLITGGLGAIALQVAEWLTTKGVANLVLVGRNGIRPELENGLKKLQNKAQVTIIQADVADEKQLNRALEQIELTLPPLKGIVHCAGVLEDRVISQQDWASFTKVLAPKVQGAWNLHNLTQKYDLESFILFSSASSLLGAAGQVNYCAANAFLDVLAHARRAQGLPAIAINWGAWKNTGLASETHISESLQQKGIGSIDPQQGIEILEQLLLHSPTQMGVIPIDWNLWQANNIFAPFYEELISEQAISETNFKQQLSVTTSEQRQALLIAQITQQVANILGIKDLNTIDLDLGFSELGLDSLGSVELRNKLQSNYDMKLPATVIFDYSNIKVLADYLFSILFTKESSQETVDPETENCDLTEFENLSEVEAEAMLLEELKDFNF
ncbi:polyketide synthase family protein [Xenococcus sp. PCC 7305]|uniref:type I polyketide synthase n=1 Tax=Xenococcus sp. PCC 7305 TaxID=102125 RepID=UPI0002ACB820|nr:type I polyketide synthase [Xenococcus sp. PCC 7305]ELS02296.1 polyketide synthase family protein [Xenococcus sp. PCC 7305]